MRAIRAPLLLLLGAALPLAAAESAHGQMAMETEAPMEMGSMQGGAPPADARDPHAYSDGVDFTRGDSRPRLADQERMHSVLIDNLEFSRIDSQSTVDYDVEAWFGRTYDRAVLKSDAEFESGDLNDSRTELLWSHAMSAYWDSQIGIRQDGGDGPGRSWLAAGIEGLAPYRFDIELTAYVGESSRTALRFDAAYDMLLTQKLIFQPRFEANFYGRGDIERGLGSGLSDVSLALRLRYEFRRELAPYIGLEWIDEHGGTEALTRARGADPSDSRVMLGLRFWF